MTHAERPAPMPPGWPRDRYRTTHRAMKVFRIADHLLRHGLAYSSAEATDPVIRAAAAACGENEPSSTSCLLVREAFDFLLSPHRPPASSGGRNALTIHIIRGPDA
ncbi:hypothetical protein [Streptomyces sp. BRA346]|uniref:hypothetical protein n=1 Tax=Streptomyces sp. BRA346 TaxID=2878199 RepID=UPI004062B8C2